MIFLWELRQLTVGREDTGEWGRLLEYFAIVLRMVETMFVPGNVRWWLFVLSSSSHISTCSLSLSLPSSFDLISVCSGMARFGEIGIKVLDSSWVYCLALSLLDESAVCLRLA